MAGDTREELRLWYVRSLLPKLVQAVYDGTVASAAVASLDRQVRELLELPRPADDGR